jgi:hypothetical protein
MTRRRPKPMSLTDPQAEEADAFARLQQAHALLSESEDNRLQQWTQVMEWLLVIYGTYEPTKAKAEARVRLVTDLRSLTDSWTPEDEE